LKAFFCETFDDGTVGGSHRCMFNLLRCLPRDEIRATAGFLGPNVYVEKYREIGIDVEILSFPAPILHGTPVIRKARNWYNLVHRVERHLMDYLREKAYDIVVLNNSVYVSLPYVKACRRLGIPLAIYERGIARYAREHLVASAHLAASIPVSDAVLENVKRSGFRTKLIKRIYDGIDTEAGEARRSPEQVRSDLGIPREARILGILGNVRFWKGQETFVESFRNIASRYPQAYGLIIGGWGEADREYYHSIRSLIARYGLEERVRLLGYRMDVPDLLGAIDVVVHASTKPEPFGMVLLEAMRAGKPVVAANIGGPVEILDGGACGLLVPPHDSEAIAAACARYLDNQAFADEMVRRGRERLKAEFDIRKTVDETVRLFREVRENYPNAG
jgi:glycosyltransferase involved in cell wall biosynthesis